MTVSDPNNDATQVLRVIHVGEIEPSLNEPAQVEVQVYLSRSVDRFDAHVSRTFPFPFHLEEGQSELRVAVSRGDIRNSLLSLDTNLREIDEKAREAHTRHKQSQQAAREAIKDLKFD